MVISDDVLSLNTIALETGTDKASTGHGYCAHYESLFKHLRDKPITLLEIGVDQGRSLAMWYRYFPNGQIVGIDTNPACQQYRNARTRIFTGDQSDIEFLKTVMQNIGPCDIIIDDGSHRYNDFVTSWNFLWPYMTVGGFYCIEDMGTCVLPEYDSIAAGPWFNQMMLGLLFGKDHGCHSIYLANGLVVFETRSKEQH